MAETAETVNNDLRAAMSGARSNTGETLLEMSERGPVLLVFLRHLGCTFCKEAAADVAKMRGDIEGADADGVSLAFVYMPGNGDDDAQEKRAHSFFGKYGLDDVARFADAGQSLYRAFGLGRGSIGQLFGVKSFTRGFVAGVLKGHGVGTLVGDGFQMPGVFLVRDGAIERGYRHETAADVPDYVGLACGTGIG